MGFWDTNGSSNLGQATRASDSQQKKKKLPNSEFSHFGEPQGKTEGKRKQRLVPGDKYLKTKDTMKHDGDINSNWRTRFSHWRIDTGTGRLGNERTSGDHPIYSIVDIGWNIKKSPGYLRKLAVTQTPVKKKQ